MLVKREIQGSLIAQVAPRDSAAKPPRRRDWGVWPALVLAPIGFLAIICLDLFVVDPAKPVAVVFAATTSADDALLAVAAAGGRPIRLQESALTDHRIWLAEADSPDFFDRVRANGALTVVNPYALGGCLLLTPR